VPAPTKAAVLVREHRQTTSNSNNPPISNQQPAAHSTKGNVAVNATTAGGRGRRQHLHLYWGFGVVAQMKLPALNLTARSHRRVN